MKEIFIDTSAFYALADKKDPAHKKATIFYKKNKYPLVTTNYIFAETLSLITKRLGKKIAINFGEGLRKSKIIRLVYLPGEYEEKAWNLFCQFEDKKYDYIDCTCFVFIDENFIDKVFTFDRHFFQKEYLIEP